MYCFWLRPTCRSHATHQFHRFQSLPRTLPSPDTSTSADTDEPDTNEASPIPPDSDTEDESITADADSDTDADQATPEWGDDGGPWSEVSGWPGGGWCASTGIANSHGDSSGNGQTSLHTNGGANASRDGLGSHQAEAWHSWGTGTPWSWTDLPSGTLRGAPLQPRPVLGATVLVIPEEITIQGLEFWVRRGFYFGDDFIEAAWLALAPLAPQDYVGNAARRAALRELKWHALAAFQEGSPHSRSEVQLQHARELVEAHDRETSKMID
ncbi:hypothetical protein B0H14DRAFT_3469065 [Mycena olivaceomarginata]|nr:hypothetical protein B0H14DRAFT_3469065 [Mycena olivaceomarginata]